MAPAQLASLDPNIQEKLRAALKGDPTLAHEKKNRLAPGLMDGADTSGSFGSRRRAARNIHAYAMSPSTAV
jgi:hypothetical protein